MKKAFIFLFLCFSLVVFAEKYQVKVNSLNIRSKASKYSDVIGRLQKGDVINVEKFSNRWGRVYTQRYGYGWVYTSSKFVTKTQGYKKAAPVKAASHFNFFESHRNNTCFYFFYVILGLGVIMFFLRHFRKSNPLEGRLYIVGLCLFIISSISILIYQFGFGDFTWFIGDNPWYITILLFIVFGGFTHEQSRNLTNILEAISWENSVKIPFVWGISGFSITFILYFILLYYNSDYIYFPFILLFFTVSYQSFLIFKNFSILQGVLLLFVFLLGSLATIILYTQFIKSSIWAAVIILLIYSFLSDMHSQKSENHTSSIDFKPSSNSVNFNNTINSNHPVKSIKSNTEEDYYAPYLYAKDINEETIKGCNHFEFKETNENTFRFMKIEINEKIVTRLNIAGPVNGKDITELANYAIRDYIRLKEISLSSKIKRIGTGAFLNCKKLKDIEIPERVTEIKDCTFCNCYNLKYVSLSENLKRIGERAFFECRSLLEIIIHKSVVEIDESAFLRCKSLKKVSIWGNISEIKQETFANCFNLKEVYLPKGLSKIKPYAFANCTNLKHLTLPDSIKEIEQYAFKGCTKLEQITMPKSVKIAHNAFQGCDKLNQKF